MSNRITKDLAEKLAKELTKSKREFIQTKRYEFSDLLEQEVLKTIPEKIKNLAKEYPQYFNYTDDVNISGNGFNYSIYTLKRQFINNTGSYYAVFTPSESVAKKLLQIEAEIEKLNQSYKILVENLKAAFYNLRTVDKVIKEFPEAEPFLQQNNNTRTALAINYSELRNLLKA